MTLNPWVLLVVGIAWVASMVGVGAWQNGVGHVEERVEWQAKDNEELRLANAEITRLNDKARADERAHATRLDAVSTQYQKEMKNAKAQRDRDVADARTGALRLQFNTGRVNPGGSEAGDPAATPGRCDGGTTAELPREVVADLFSLVNDADEVTKQLTACQAVVRSDRNVGSQ